jgi:hypothetical protein
VELTLLLCNFIYFGCAWNVKFSICKKCILPASRNNGYSQRDFVYLLAKTEMANKKLSTIVCTANLKAQ